MTNYINIGNAILAKMTGLKENKVVYKVDCSSCSNCNHYKLMQEAGFSCSLCNSIQELYCSACQHKELFDSAHYAAVKAYDNETNRYGYSKRFSKVTIKLYILLHFCGNITSTGLIKNVSISYLADILKVSHTAIRNSLEILHNENIVLHAAGDYKGYYHFYICEYQSYFLSAKQGGRGYTKISKNMLEQIIAIDDVNTLRILLRGIITLSRKEYSSPAALETHDVPVKNILDFLPSYCRKHTIINCFSKLKNIFKFEETTHYIQSIIHLTFESKHFNINANKVDYVKEEYNNIIKFRASLANDVAYINNSLINNTACEPASIVNHDFFNEMDYERLDRDEQYSSLSSADFIKRTDMMPLAEICFKYSFDIVRKALSLIFKDYYLKGKRDDIAGLSYLVVGYIRDKILPAISS